MQMFAIKKDIARVGFEQIGNGEHQGAFAGTIWTNQC